MHAMHTDHKPAARPAFSVVELMIVIVIIIVTVAIGATAYLRAIPQAQNRTAAEHMRTVAGALQFYYQEQHDYPLMRYNDVIFYTSSPNPNWPNHANDPVPNAPQSVEACLYMLENRTSADKALQRLPASIYKQLQWYNKNPPPPTYSDTVVDGPAGTRPLHAILDPWGNPVQYLRPRTGTADYPLSAQRLNNRALLVSMGPDGLPGKAGVNDATGAVAAGADFWQDNRGDGTLELFPDPVQLGRGDDIVVDVGLIP